MAHPISKQRIEDQQVYIAGVITAKGHKNWRLGTRANELMVLWLVSKMSKRLNVSILSIVFLPTKLRLLVAGRALDIAELFQAVCSAIVDRMKSSTDGVNTYSYCELTKFRVATTPEIINEYLSCAVSQVAEGLSAEVETCDLYNSFFDSIAGESVEMLREQNVDPLLSRFRLGLANLNFKIKYERLPNCAAFNSLDYRQYVEDLMQTRLKGFRKFQRECVGELAAKRVGR